jgi:kynurenine formamidase
MCLPGTVEAVREQQPQLSRRTVLAGGGAAALAALLPGEAIAHRRRPKRRSRVVDLTHTFTAGFPVYTGAAPTRRTLVTVEDDGFYSQEWTFGEHSGTHLDVPGHFVADGRRVTALRPKELILPIVVIDISRRAASDPDAAVTPDDLQRFERRHGRIPNGALVAMNSGWASKVGDDAAFKGGPAGAYHFPGFGEDAIDLLSTSSGWGPTTSGSRTCGTSTSCRPTGRPPSSA